MVPTYGGLALFGRAPHITMVPNANAAQVAAFFGVTGVMSMDGGGRGRIFECSGLMAGIDAAAVQANAAQLLNLSGPTARLLIDTTGTPWPNIVFRNEFTWIGDYMLECGTGLRIRQYRCVLHGLT